MPIVPKASAQEVVTFTDWVPGRVVNVRSTKHGEVVSVRLHFPETVKWFEEGQRVCVLPWGDDDDKEREKPFGGADIVMLP